MFSKKKSLILVFCRQMNKIISLLQCSPLASEKVKNPLPRKQKLNELTKILLLFETYWRPIGDQHA